MKRHSAISIQILLLIYYHAPSSPAVHCTISLDIDFTFIDMNKYYFVVDVLMFRQFDRFNQNLIDADNRILNINALKQRCGSSSLIDAPKTKESSRLNLFPFHFRIRLLKTD